MRGSRRIPIVMSLLLLILLLAGCAAGDRSSDSAAGEAAAEETRIAVSFRVMPEEAGTIAGSADQSLLIGERTARVEAQAAPGYVFSKWSDGEKTVFHREKKYSEDTVIYAIFDESDEKTPVIRIETPGAKRIVSDSRLTACTISVDNMPKRFCLDGAAAQIKCRGNASLGWPKRSYTIRTEDKVRLCGVGEGKNRNWVLISNHCDQSLLRNYISFWLQNQLDGIPWSPSCRMVELYINGEYAGSYMLIEKITTGENRIAIDNGTSLRSDFLVELDNYANKAGEKGVVWFTARGYPYEIRGEDNPAANRCDYIDKWITDTWDVICSGTERDIRRILDVDSAVDSYILAEVTKNIDCGWSSFFLYRRDGKLFLGPSWDFDLALGNDYRLDNGSYRGLYAAEERGFSQQNHWYIELMKYDWFHDLVVERWTELMEEGLFDRCLDELDRVWNMNRDSLEHNFERWPIFGSMINQEPEHIRAISTAEDHVAYLRQWIVNRVEWLDRVIRPD